MCTTAPVGVLAFWGGMLLAARGYPAEYDWRFITISSLLYPDRNPSGYLWAWGGIGLCGLAGLHWTAELVPRGKQPGVTERPIGVWALGVGYLCMMCCAWLPGWLLPIPKAHELLALAAFIGICVGLVYSTFNAVAAGARPGNQLGNPRFNAVMLAGLALSPLVLASLAQAYVSYALPSLPWVSLAWRARGIPVYLSFAFWEWVTCAVFSVYMLVLSGMNLCAGPNDKPARA